ncbi:hypothetical protein GQ53DRAFT_744277 [Thozetella sp. PMI_491]|nr:hypothetical protein GQ53DRAFT_744277 [Thozetella sp. PMI_491]
MVGASFVYPGTVRPTLGGSHVSDLEALLPHASTEGSALLFPRDLLPVPSPWVFSTTRCNLEETLFARTRREMSQQGENTRLRWGLSPAHSLGAPFATPGAFRICARLSARSASSAGRERGRDREMTRVVALACCMGVQHWAISYRETSNYRLLRTAANFVGP